MCQSFVCFVIICWLFVDYLMIIGRLLWLFDFFYAAESNNAPSHSTSGRRPSPAAGLSGLAPRQQGMRRFCEIINCSGGKPALPGPDHNYLWFLVILMIIWIVIAFYLWTKFFQLLQYPSFGFVLFQTAQHSLRFWICAVTSVCYRGVEFVAAVLALKYDESFLVGTLTLSPCMITI